VTLGPREQFTQIGEPFKDKFALGDLNVNYNFGQVALTSITSYTHRDVDVVRDAGALTSSITGAASACPRTSTPSTRRSTTPPRPGVDPGAPPVRRQGPRPLVAGGFYANTTRDYGQTLLVAGFEDLTGIPTAGKFGAGKDVSSSRGCTTSSSSTLPLARGRCR